MDKGESVLIVGAGIFGVSTAWHLSQSSSASLVTVLDRAPFPSPQAASTDYNKIVRADYGVPFYMSLAQEALEAWEHWEMFRDPDLFHQTGWVMFDDKGSDLAARIRSNFASSGIEDPTKDLDIEEVRRNWGGILSQSDLSGFSGGYSNPKAGWAEAGRAVEVMMAQAVSRGVKYETAEAESLLLGNKGIKGVKTSDGKEYLADKVLLSTGAWTEKLMVSVEERLNLQGNLSIQAQMTAAAVCVSHFILTDSELERLKDIPVLVLGESGEILPPTADRILKITNSTSFKNTMQLSADRKISAPPTQSQNIAPRKLQEETLNNVRRALPWLLENGRQPDLWRLCWDAVTPTQNQLICRHPDERLSNLIIAAGGSYHSWKFLPIIGRYVVNVLHGESNGVEKDRRWAWKKGDEGFARGVHESIIPRREVGDFSD